MESKTKKSISSAGTAKDDKRMKVWDVIVIGGGASGMMAACIAAKRGRKVLLLEKNGTLGKKLLITGGGRCNVTNGEQNLRKLLEKYQESDKFLFSAFSQFGVTESLKFFNSRNMPTKTEAEKRVFPLSNKAESVWKVLVDEMQKNNVEIISKATVLGISMPRSEDSPDSNSIDIKPNSAIVKVAIKEGIKDVAVEFTTKSIVIATGGTSRPETGSTGDAYAWLRKLGHKIITPKPSLVPVRIKDAWVKEIQGITVTDIKITLIRLVDSIDPSNPNDVGDSSVLSDPTDIGNPGEKVTKIEEKEYSKKGKILFTHFGVSGPTVLNMSKDISEHIKYDRVLLSLDLKPSYDHGQMNTALQNLFAEENNRKIKNALATFIPSALVNIILEHASVNEGTVCNSVTREKRLALIESIKNLKMEVEGLLGTDKAIITSGGVELSEIDFKTMRSRVVPNIFIIGDMLNIDRPSGGYSLQLCWTTGFVAGSNA